VSTTPGDFVEFEIPPGNLEFVDAPGKIYNYM